MVEVAIEDGHDVLVHDGARLLRLEPAYDLSAWAADRPGQPGGLPLLARARWQRLLKRLDEAAQIGWRAAVERAKGWAAES